MPDKQAIKEKFHLLHRWSHFQMDENNDAKDEEVSH